MLTPLEMLYLSTAVVSVGTGVVIFLLNPHRTVNRAFVVTSTAVTLWFLSVFMVIREARFYTPATHANHIFWLRFGMAAAGTLPWSMKLLINALSPPPQCFSTILRRSWSWMVVSGALVALTFSEFFIPSDTTPFAPKWALGYSIYFSVLALEGTVLIILGYRQMQQLSGVRRIETQIFVLNMVLAGILVALSVYAGRMFNIPPLSRSAPFIFIVSYGITVWTICSHRIFDARQVIASLAHRIVQLVFLGAVAVILAAMLHQKLEWPHDILLAAASTGLLALICERPSRRWFGLDHDHRLIEPRRKVVKIARRETDAAKLQLSFESYLCSWCQADRVVLLPSRDAAFAGTDLTIPAQWPGLGPLCRTGWITPELLQRRKPEAGTQECVDFLAQHNLGALLAIPPGSDSPTLMLALGSKRGLRPYTYPDIRLLLNLAELMDNILTHANLAIHAAKIARMEAAAIISRSLAHDLSNLTMPVASYLLHAQDRAVPGTPEADVYEAAVHSVKVMHDYIRESLFFSRRLVPDLMEVDPSEYLASLLRLTQERAVQRQITLQCDCQTRTRFIADPVLLQRLALNLVNNAIDASPQHTVVIISIADRNTEQIYLTVSDQGSGIRPENLQRIFDPYFTTKDTGSSMRGLGLGLAICQKIAELHGGRIEVSSEWGKGTTFTVTFPLDHTTEQAARSPEVIPPSRAIPIYQQALPRPA
jgi:signal transduction histidine kinase